MSLSRVEVFTPRDLANAYDFSASNVNASGRVEVLRYKTKRLLANAVTCKTLTTGQQCTQLSTLRCAGSTFAYFKITDLRGRKT